MTGLIKYIIQILHKINQTLEKELPVDLYMLEMISIFLGINS